MFQLFSSTTSLVYMRYSCLFKKISRIYKQHSFCYLWMNGISFIRHWQHTIISTKKVINTKPYLCTTDSIQPSHTTTNKKKHLKKLQKCKYQFCYLSAKKLLFTALHFTKYLLQSNWKSHKQRVRRCDLYCHKLFNIIELFSTRFLAGILVWFLRQTATVVSFVTASNYTQSLHNAEVCRRYRTTTKQGTLHKTPQGDNTLMSA